MRWSGESHRKSDRAGTRKEEHRTGRLAWDRLDGRIRLTGNRAQDTLARRTMASSRVGKTRSEVLRTGGGARTGTNLRHRILPGAPDPFSPGKEPRDRHILLLTWNPALDPRFLLLPRRRLSSKYSSDDA
uniref:Uncharacterized protein n=1 Tax=Knipowitschia caucasica TaxID=637954 RepID=A0AAV2KYD7_KNICA